MCSGMVRCEGPVAVTPAPPHGHEFSPHTLVHTHGDCRCCCFAWGGAGGCNRSQGGAEAEREERNRQIEAKRQKERDNAESFRRMQEEARTRRGRLQEELAESQLLDEEENDGVESQRTAELKKVVSCLCVCVNAHVCVFVCSYVARNSFPSSFFVPPSLSVYMPDWCDLHPSAFLLVSAISVLFFCRLCPDMLLSASP